MNKLAVILAAAMLTLTLGGCGHTHQWQEATCTAPKTCAECGETEGEPLAHQWQEATCSAPKTCAVCGATEGTALEHQMGEATSPSPAVCTVCGAEVGEPLPAAMAGFTLVEADQDYDYQTVSPNDPSLSIAGTFRVENYRVIESDEEHEAKEGYEWRLVDVRFTIDDENARRSGYATPTATVDYYEGPQDSDAETANINGEKFPSSSSINIRENTWTPDGVAHVLMEHSFQVPIGYDGGVVCIYSFAYYPLESMDDVNAANPMIFRLV